MSKISNKLTVLVNTCDLYKDIWPLFFAALDEYWPNRTVSLILNTEKEKYNIAKNVFVSNFTAVDGNDSWGLRLIKSLTNIDTEYVLVVYDDFILEGVFDEQELNTLICRMDDDPNIAAVYLTKLGLQTNKNNNLINDREIFKNKYEILEDNIDFRLNSAPALWRRKDLLAYTGKYDNPWAWEVFGSYRTFGDGKKMYCPAEGESDVYKYNYKKGGAIYRGKWVREVVVDKDEKYQLDIDFSKRGFSMDNGHEKRSLKWKVQFVLLGYRMIGFKVFVFIYKSLKGKFA